MSLRNDFSGRPAFGRAGAMNLNLKGRKFYNLSIISRSVLLFSHRVRVGTRKIYRHCYQRYNRRSVNIGWKR